MPAPVALLLIAHGTRVPEGAQEMAELIALLRDEHDGPVAHAWLEDFAEPHAADATASLAAAGADRVVVVPFLNFRAYHARSDVPAEVARAGAAHPSLRFTLGEVLGHHPALVELAERRVRAARAAAGLVQAPDADEVLVVAASGSSDAGSNGDVAKAARLVAEATSHRWVEIAFAGVTWPTAEEAIRRAARAGAQRVTLFSWSLLAGLLERKVAEQARAAAERTGVEVVDAGRFGPDALVARAVLDRAREAASAAFPWD